MPKWARMLVIGIVGILVVGAIMAMVLTAGLSEVKNLEIAHVDLTIVADGKYVGAYSHGRWRRWEVEVDVQDHQMVGIRVLSEHGPNLAAFHKTIIGEVLAAQRLQIDVVSGATVDTKIFLKAVENSLTNN